MFFKNAQIYRLSHEWPITTDELNRQLRKRPAQPPGSQDMESRGWAAPGAVENDEFVYHVGENWLICMQTEKRVLPSRVVAQEAAARAAEVEAQQGYKVGRKQMKELKEAVASELMPRAFTQTGKTYAWINVSAGWLVVDAPSQARAEELLEVLRQTLDTLPLGALRTEVSPTSAMAGWLASNEAPAGFTIDQDCELRSVTEDKAAVRYVHHCLDGTDVPQHLEAGKLPTRLALTFNDRISFVLTEKLEIKRLDFLDVVKDKLDEAGAEDARALFDAGFALMSGELLELLATVVEALGGELKREPDLVDRAKEGA